MESYVWAVTTIRKVDTKAFPFDARTVGLFKQQADAIEAVLGNYGDMNECGYYPWAVVEKIILNCLYPSDREGTWFQWVGEEEGEYQQFDGKAVTEHPALGGFSGRIANWSQIG